MLGHCTTTGKGRCPGLARNNEGDGGTLSHVFAFGITCRPDAEEKRRLAEQLNEEELVIFDLLTKSAVVLTPQETADVKTVARSLFDKRERKAGKR
jgi:hypothetical protein